MKGILIATSTICVAMLLLSGCATNARSLQERGLSALNHSQLEKLMSRTRTARWTTATGASGTATYFQDGRAEVDWNGGGAEGTWRIKANTLCTKYLDIREGKETCFTGYRTQANVYQWFFPDGSLNSTLTFTS